VRLFPHLLQKTSIATAFALALSIASPSLADDLAVLCEQFPQNSRCTGYIPKDVSSGKTRDAATGLRLVAIEGDWRVPNLDVPWSEAIIFRDPFDGGTATVFDRNFSGDSYWGGSQTGVMTKWTLKTIGVFAYKKTRSCGFLTCRDSADTSVVGKTLEIKISEKIFRLEGEDGLFPVSEELGKALANAPVGQALIRVNLAGTGASSTNPIGEKTVQAWKRIYQATAPVESKP
jgi:hypothetical protein